MSIVVVRPQTHLLWIEPSESKNVFWALSALSPDTGKYYGTVHQVSEGCIAVNTTSVPNSSYNILVRMTVFCIKHGDRTVVPFGNAVVRLQGPGRLEGICLAHDRKKKTHEFETILLRYNQEFMEKGKVKICASSEYNVADITPEACKEAETIRINYQKNIKRLLTAEEIQTEKKSRPSQHTENAATTLKNLALHLHDWRQSGLGLCTGQPLDPVFTTTTAYFANWITQACRLFLSMNPVDVQALQSLAKHVRNETVSRSTYACILALMCGPYDPESEDSRDTTLLFGGLRQDCDGASQTGAHIHRFIHKNVRHICELLIVNKSQASLLAYFIVTWTYENTETDTRLALCYADPEIAFGNVDITDAKGLGKFSMHQVLLVKLKPFLHPRWFVCESTGLFMQSNSKKEDAVWKRKFDPKNDIGYGCVKPYDPSRYRLFVQLRCEQRMTLCSPASEGLPFGWSLNDTLSGTFQGLKVKFQSPKLAPMFCPEIHSRNYSDVTTKILNCANSLPRQCTDVSNLRPTSLSTALPSYCYESLNFEVSYFWVGPWAWIAVETNNEKPISATSLSKDVTHHSLFTEKVIHIIL